ncbi:hypothetical protein DJ72_04600, partial [Halorubrum distributum]
MTATQPDSPRLTRRELLRTTAGGVGVAVGVGALGSTARPAGAIDWGSVGKTAALAAVSPPVALGWALREYEVLGSDSPAEGLTADALEQQANQTSLTRQSTNASTIVDNGTILDGVENTAYTDAKIAAIELLNDGASESEVLEAANDAIDSYFTTVEKNLLKTWNESVRELRSLMSALESHSDTGIKSVYTVPYKSSDGFGAVDEEPPYLVTDERSIDFTLSDGTTFTIERIAVKGENGYTVGYGPTGGEFDAETQSSNEQIYTPEVHFADDEFYLSHDEWNAIHSEIQTTYTNVSDGISTWVTNVYGDVQSGEIEITELITPRERAAMLSDDESEAQAIADLAALNIPIDSEREATITITETGARLSGTIGLTDESDGPIESGATYDPTTFSGDVYLTADVSQLSGTWNAYETGVDGGTITLTAQPYEGTVLNVTTTAGETVSVPAGDWTDNGDGTYSYDASAELETTITEVDSVEYVSGADQTQYETLNLSKEFTVESIVNRETGEQTSSASFESSEPQSDSNYITQDEWDQLEQQNQELIEKYEESQNTGGGAGAGWFAYTKLTLP